MSDVEQVPGEREAPDTPRVEVRDLTKRYGSLRLQGRDRNTPQAAPC